MNNKKPISILICALGGEGGGVLTQWVVDAARLAGFPVQATSIPGVAQRTGATTYYIEIYPDSSKALGEQEIVFGLNPLPGQLDLLISSELLEAARQVSNGMSSKTKTMVISSTGRVLTTAEKMHLGDGRVDSKQLISLIDQFSLSNYFVDMVSMTQQASTVISSVMLGCMAASGLLPMEADAYRNVIGEGSQSQKASLKGFNLGFQAIENQRQQLAYLDSVLKPNHAHVELNRHDSTVKALLPQERSERYPKALQELLDLAFERLMAYQNQDYAELFLSRLDRILGAEQVQSTNDHRVTEESLKRLAVLMCFDDLVHVAQLKMSVSRFERVSKEVKAGENDLLKIYDHFKPGVEELAAMLPVSLARKLMDWSARRQSKGLSPISLPLKLGSHTIHGLIMLKLLAACKFLRPMSSRYHDEQILIEKWVNHVVEGTKRSANLGFEIAKCASLIKGYGSTHARSRENFNHIMDHVVSNTQFHEPQDCANAIALARTTAMKDEGGKVFDQTLKGMGLPERSPRYQPIRWMSKSEMAKRRLN